MAPIVYGLEEAYRDRVDFLYLDISHAEVRPVMNRFGFEATPHFFLRTVNGRVVWSRQGAVREDELRQEFEAVLASS